MKLLLVGDPHVTVEELKDAQALLDGVYSVFTDTKPDYVVFLGDLHHNHALVRVEVTDFWMRNLAKFPKDRCLVMVGNHDRPNDTSLGVHALQPYRSIVTVVESPTLIQDVLFMPYMPNDKFVATWLDVYAKHRPTTLVCHQTFDGSKYENGFFAPDGIDPCEIGVPVIISGHIHSQQVVNWVGGYVHYVGSPRWRTMSDVNERKHILLWDTSEHTYRNFLTSDWCSPMQHLEVSNGVDLARISQHPEARVYIDAIAPKAQLEALVAQIKKVRPDAKVRPVQTDKTVTVAGVAESQGVSKALARYLRAYTPKHGTDPKLLRDMIVRELAMEIL